MRYEQKAALQDSNKARMYEEKKKKDKLKIKNFYLKTQKLVNDEFKQTAKRMREENE
jgi:hypothetical protein|tara:strand:- start:100 stop:270 length:171 start_codon:yes stop_codon:yes gene_type:complete